MKFEYDADKSQSNKLKHGVDFEETQQIWKGLYVEFAARQEYEDRFAIIGPIHSKLYTCIYALREGKVRIISCRRSREKEEKLYEKSTPKT